MRHAIKILRPIRIVGDIAYVPLTKGYQAIIDATDVGLVYGMNWQAIGKDGHAIYASSVSRGRKAILMHRLIIQAPQELECDHIDRNGLNNRRSNLRLATVAQNQWNRPASKNNKSGFKGVHWHSQQKKWRVRISKNGKQLELGAYHSPEEGHAVYVKANRKLHGEFGRIS